MADPVRYHVDLADRVHHLVRVTVHVPADADDGARVVLPVWTPGSYVVRDYVRHLQSIEAVDGAGDAVPLAPDGGTAWRLPPDRPGPIAVTLELYANDLSVRTNHVDDHHALLIPAATFPYVEGTEHRPHEVHLPPVPASHRVWSLLPAGDTPHTFVANHRDHLIDSAFEVGDLPEVTVDVRGVPHRFVWAGHGGDPDLQRVAGDIAVIAEAAADLFDGALPIEHYTFLTVGWDEGGGGLEHRDGAVLQTPIDTFQDADRYARFQSLIAHEYLHLWNVKRLVPAALVRPHYDRPTHTESLWVAEGWTAYYDDLLPLRAKRWTVRRYLDTLAEVHRRVADAPGVARQSLRQASYQAWTKHYRRDENAPNAMTDYYGHGALVAWELDLRLRAHRPDGDGLDEVLRLLWDRHGNAADGYTEGDVLAAVAAVGDDQVAALAERRVDEPGLPDLEELVDVVGLRWVTVSDPTTPHLGVEVTDDERGPLLRSVLRDGPAWRAGLAGGDRLLAIDGRVLGSGALRPALLPRRPGDTVELTVARGPRLLRRRVVLGPRRPPRRLEPVADASATQRASFERWTHHAFPDR